ncbi:MAG: hypothetical protein PHT84_02670 [Candidatus Pacebacteria bacterium]|nr:hypothetical protein [Candidatus Paceibacterota bacterium]
MMRIDIAPGYLDKAPDNSFNFVGVLRKYFYTNGDFNPINKNWNEDTQSRYLEDYERRLIPCLGELKAMHEYEEEDFIAALIKLREQYQYGEKSMAHYTQLIWRVYKAGLENCLYEDKIFWEDLDDGRNEKSRRNEKERLILTKKSFTIEEEKKLLVWAKSLDPKSATGQEIGLLLMFLFGLRNQEACGLDFGGIKLLTMQKYPCLYIYQTTSGTGNSIKAGGKTSNAARIIPIFNFIYNFLLERRHHIEEYLQCTSSQVQGARVEGIDKIPVVCKNNQYETRASSRDLTELGRNLFRILDIREDARKELKRTQFSQKMSEIDIGEKDATTYLFRRNFATNLYCLGLTCSEIQYLIGHDVENPVETRNYLTNEDNISVMKEKLDEHPYILFFEKDRTKCIIINDDIYRNDGNALELLELNASKLGSEYRINITAEEPLDNILVTFHDHNCYEYTCTKDYKYDSYGCKETVNIRTVIKERYKRKLG